MYAMRPPSKITHRIAPLAPIVIVLAWVSFIAGLVIDWKQKHWAPPTSSTDSAPSWFRPQLENAFLQLPERLGNLRAIAFNETGKRVWIAGDHGQILRSENGGETWSELKRPEIPHVFDIFYEGNNRLWATGEKGVILVSDDGGDTWRISRKGTEGDRLRKVVVRGKAGWAAGEKPVLLKWNGNGEWTTANLRSTTALYDIQIDGASGALAVGAGGAIVRLAAKSPRPLKPITIDLKPNLYGLAFAKRSAERDSTLAWAVGQNGTVVHTTDGGTKWKRKDTGSTNTLADVFFVDEKTGWAVGANGTILHTADGGETWRVKERITENYLMAVRFHGSIGIIAGANGEILRTTNGGTTWVRDINNRFLPFRSVTFLDGQRGWAAGLGGKILATEDGGKTWKMQPSDVKDDLHAVHFINEKNGVAAGANGRILHTTDGGQSWKRAETPQTEAVIRALCMTSEGNGWAVGDEMTIWRTADSGKTWTPQGVLFETEPLIVNLYSVDCSDDVTAAAAGSSGVTLKTVIGAPHWYVTRAGRDAELHAVKFVDDKVVVAAGSEGRILRSTDGGESWGGLISISSSRFHALTLGKDGALFVAGEDGQIFKSEDKGASWSQIQFPNKANIYAIYDEDKGAIWTVGDKSAFQRSTDGGKSWTPLQMQKKSPPATRFFYYAGAILASLGVGLLVVDMKRRAAPVSSTGPPHNSRQLSVSEVLANDSPLPPDEKRDAIGTHDVADAIAAFILNQDTEPSLTVAVAGPWGAGKSSLLARIRYKLEKGGYRAVVYNAWYHEKEKRQLTSLLETIRREALPKFPGSLRFMVKMFWKRGWMAKCAALLLIIFFLALQLLHARTWVRSVHAQFGWHAVVRYCLFGHGIVVAKEQALNTTASDATGENGSSNDPDAIKKTVNTILSNGMRTFLSYQQLYDTVAKAAGKSELGEEERRKLNEYFTETKPELPPITSRAALILIVVLVSVVLGDAASFRLWLAVALERFMKMPSHAMPVGAVNEYQRLFNRIAEVLNERDEPVAILIDDLDRCRPDTMLEVLEVINYLANPGPCYVVVATDPEVLLSALPGTSEGVKRRYLEKIFNVAVAVPRMKRGQAAEVAEVTAAGPSAQASAATENKSGGGRRWLRALLKVAFGAALILAAYKMHSNGWLRRIWEEINKIIDPPAIVISSDKPGPSPGRPRDPSPPEPIGPPEGGGDDPLPEPRKGERPVDPTPVIPQENRGTEIPLILFLAANLFAAVSFVWRVMIRRKRVKSNRVEIKDSQEFKDALSIWLDVVAMISDTPRAIKRFINRVRIAAALYRNPVQANIKESQLVALISLATLLEEPASLIPLVCGQTTVNQTRFVVHGKEIIEALKKHSNAFPADFFQLSVYSANGQEDIQLACANLQEVCEKLLTSMGKVLF